jgi:hypothetical protein
MAALRSTQLYSGDVAGTAVRDLYTVPSGMRAVIKHVTIQEISGSSCIAQLRLASLSTIYAWNVAAYGGSGMAIAQNFWVVVNAGDKIQFERSTSGDLNVTVSGSLYTV